MKKVNRKEERTRSYGFPQTIKKGHNIMVSHRLQRKDTSFWFSTDCKERTQYYGFPQTIKKDKILWFPTDNKERTRSYGFPQTIKKGHDIMVSHR